MMVNKSLPKPAPIGSYREEDVIFLLKDLSSEMIEDTTEYRERAIQSGTHYSEMLPIEYQPTEEYVSLFHQSLNEYKRKIALSVAIVAEKVVKQKGLDIVIVSLARAGTPIGILIKRYLSFKYNHNVPHYSVSIIRDRGIDENAIHYIVDQHPNRHIQFVDGWTGKGAISKELSKACDSYKEKYQIFLDDSLAVLADPGHCAPIYGTREDFLIPSACLNSTVSGLVSRTVLNKQFIQDDDFHGAKFYQKLLEQDVSNFYIEVISNQFDLIQDDLNVKIELIDQQVERQTWSGFAEIQQIQKQFQIDNIHYIKPGVGETTRVLLRRVPWKVLVKKKDDPRLAHILLLAKNRGVPVEVFENMSYSCCGLIKPMDVKR